MNKIDWCFQIKNGLQSIEPNENLCNAYFDKAGNALQAAATLKQNKEWEISSRYYAMYFALYALFMKIGIKCENHSCTIEFMKHYLTQFFSKKDTELLQSAMKARIDVQYYTDRVVDEKEYEEIKKESPLFLVKCRDVRKKLSGETITNIRNIVEQKIKDTINTPSQ